MKKSIVLPELGEGVHEGELVKWLVKIGDRVEADQAIAEMMTDKATVEVPSPVAGTVLQLKASEGKVVKVGSELIELELMTAGSGKAAAAPQATAVASPPQKSPSPAAAATLVRTESSAVTHPPVADLRVLATPSTRRLAREIGVDINSLSGSGLSGRVTREDVERAGNGAVAPASTPAPLSSQVPVSAPPRTVGSVGGKSEERIPLRGVRKKIAENMQAAKRTIPHFTILEEADVTELVRLREQAKGEAERQGTKITFLPFIAKALIATLREFPMVNASIDDEREEIVYKNYYNVGFAADTPTGLVVPIIKEADRISVLDFAREVVRLSEKARAGKLALDEMRGATITITNIGSIGGLMATPIINHPEVAILGVYRIQDRPVITQSADGQIRISEKKVMNLTLTADHRLIDGAVAARFLKALVARIEKPGALVLDLI